MTLGTHMRLELSQGLGLQGLADFVKEVRCEGLQHPMCPQHTAQSTYTQTDTQVSRHAKLRPGNPMQQLTSSSQATQQCFCFRTCTSSWPVNRMCGLWWHRPDAELCPQSATHAKVSRQVPIARTIKTCMLNSPLLQHACRMSTCVHGVQFGQNALSHLV